MKYSLGIILFSFILTGYKCKMRNDHVLLKLALGQLDKFSCDSSNKFIGGVLSINDDRKVRIDHDLTESFLDILCLFKNGYCFYSSRVIYSDSMKLSNFLSHMSILNNGLPNSSGTYSIVKDTISAVIFSDLNASGLKQSTFCLAKYEGIIQGDSVIKNWRIVKPYPNLKGGFLN